MKTIYERLDEILPIITDKRFRENKGLGNEIGYYIFDYDPDVYKRQLLISIIRVSLFQVTCPLQKKDYWNLEVSITLFQVKGFL